MTGTSIHRHFNHLDDPRLNRRKKYPLINLILWKEAAVEAAKNYVVNEQGLPMSVFENKNRIFNRTI